MNTQFSPENPMRKHRALLAAMLLPALAQADEATIKHVHDAP